MESSSKRVTPTGRERTFGENDIIVSKTDTKGIITYANDVFLNIAGYKEEEVIGQPHSLIRHPDMPRCVFKLLWDTIAEGKEIFAYVLNMAKGGDHYWVLAHVTPTFNEKGQITGYHSNRRVPRKDALNVIEGVYNTLRQEENKYSNRKDGMNAAYALLVSVLKEKGVSYEEFIFSF